jgi:hypothetical protein
MSPGDILELNPKLNALARIREKQARLDDIKSVLQYVPTRATVYDKFLLIGWSGMVVI